MTGAGTTARLLAAVAVSAQLVYPLVHGVARQQLSAVVVVLFAAAVLAAAGRANAVRVLAVAGLGGFAVEVWGVRTGVPFGAYAYTGHLGPRLVGVPLVVPLAWSMMAWPARCVAHRLAAGHLARVAVGAVALASWDLLLDPQMVAAGSWRWAPGSPALQGIPLRNDLGWLVCSVTAMAILERVCRGGADDRLPVGLWVWTWLGTVLADVAFLGLPGAAVVGGLGMGVVGVPLLAQCLPQRRASRTRVATA